jgi:VWFA-related protein
MLHPDFSVSRRRLLFSALSAAIAARAQSPQPAEKATDPKSTVFTTDVRVVNVFATVRDKKGAIVRNLTQSDFTLDEDGRPQVIRYFSQESNLPLTLGLLVDTSFSQSRVLGQERTASLRFLSQVLREDKDQAFVIHFDHEVELLQDLTSSRRKLDDALNQLELPDRGGSQQGGGRQGPRQRGSWRGGGTSLYDSVLLASDELMSKQSGRKALILLTDGVDNGSKVSLTSAIESAQKADTLVYSILFSDQGFYGARPSPGGRGGGWGRHGGGFPGGGGGYPGGGGGYPRAGQGRQRPDGKAILQQLSRETGGGFFEVSKKQSIEKTYDQIEEELRNQYSLGYTPDRSDSPSYRAIHVATKQSGLTVQSRSGYYTKSL